MINYITLLLVFYFNVISSSYAGDLISNTTNDCNELLNEFSVALSGFTNCSVISAQPVTLCDNCAESYFNIITHYTELTKTYENNTVCINKYINLDRLQVVDTAYKNVKNLWSKAKCDECVSYINGTKIPTKIKIEFQNIYDKFHNCTMRYNNTNTTQLCKTCIDKYIDLNNFYFNMGDITTGIEGVCMDIVDLMNKTQSKWSKVCCHYREKNELTYILTTVFMCLLPISFYVLVNLFVDIKRPSLLPQNRFAESMNTQSASYRQ